MISTCSFTVADWQIDKYRAISTLPGRKKGKRPHRREGGIWHGVDGGTSSHKDEELYECIIRTTADSSPNPPFNEDRLAAMIVINHRPCNHHPETSPGYSAPLRLIFLSWQQDFSKWALGLFAVSNKHSSKLHSSFPWVFLGLLYPGVFQDPHHFNNIVTNDSLSMEWADIYLDYDDTTTKEKPFSQNINIHGIADILLDRR